MRKCAPQPNPIGQSGRCDPFAPQNFDLQFEGAVPASEAIARSLNIPTVTMLQRYGVPKFHSLLRQMGLTTLNKPSSHYGLSLILGGAEATLWDVTSAYADMGRCLQGRERTSCALLLADSTQKAQPAVFHSGAVWQTFDALKEVNRLEEIDWRIIPSMQTIAWKTGTSYGFRDAWAVGVTTHYAVGVWVGNATVYWHLDDTYVTQTQDFHKLSLQPAAGKHSITAVDDEGNTVSVTFFVE